MKIAILSTPWIAVPPVGYGGIELVVSHVAEGLLSRGHEVMLFATGDSKTNASLEYYYKTALGNNFYAKQNPYLLLLHASAFMKKIREKQFDIIHNNAQYIPQYLLDLQDTPFVTTLHGAFYKELISPSGYMKEKRETLSLFKNQKYVSISNYQRTAMPDLSYVKTVYNGIDKNELELGKGDGGYLAWIGRITPNKGLDTAILAAKKAHMPLKVAAFIDQGDKEYFDTMIAPLIDNSITFVGEITDKKQKSHFLGEAAGLLFPVRWHEPFGLVMIEAMACGTPVIAFNKGSVSEIVVQGKTGFIVENEDEMTAAISNIGSINRVDCRDHVLSHFTIDHMVEGYLEVYNSIVKV